MTDLPEIHISDVRTFRQCRRRWEWSSGLKRNLEPYVTYAPFFTGRGIHESLEKHYQAGEDIIQAFVDFVARERLLMSEQGTLWPQEETTFEEQVTLAFNMLQHYKAWQQNDTKKYSDRNLEFLELEYPFNVEAPYPNQAYRIAGRFDGLVYNKLTDEYWIWETKTTRSVSELMGSLTNDEQSALYMYAARQVFDVPITGVLYNIIRKKAPAHPRMLQSGLLSKAAIDATRYSYLADIKEAYPTWDDDTIEEYFGDILASLDENEQKYFIRWPIYKSDLQIRNVMEGVHATALEMLNPETPLYPAPGWLMCNFCLFKSPCHTKDIGGDYELLLDEEYRTRIAHGAEIEVSND